MPKHKRFFRSLRIQMILEACRERVNQGFSSGPISVNVGKLSEEVSKYLVASLREDGFKVEYKGNNLVFTGYLPKPPI